MNTNLKCIVARAFAVVPAVALIGTVGCAGTPDDGDDADRSEEGTSAEALSAFRCDGTTDTNHSGIGNGQGSLRTVRASAHPAQGFDRFVMEFERGVAPDAYVVAPQAGTVFYGTGENETHVEGQAGIAVIFQNSLMKSSYAGPRRLRVANAKGIKEVAQYDQFEGNDEWALGTQRNPCFRTFTLLDPPRLIVDVKR
jgi:hypothetical protein